MYVWAYVLEAPRRFRRIEMPTPTPATLEPGEVILRLMTGGICGSDLPAFRGFCTYRPGDADVRGAPFPGHPLHEVVGEVISSAHPGTRVGELVVGWAAGLNGLAEYVVTDGEQLMAVGNSVVPTTAVMIQPLACVLSAVDQLRAVDGVTVAVLGQGPIGVLFSHVLNKRGAARVVGIDVVDRSDVAAEFGVAEAVHSTTDRWVHQLRDEDRPQIVIEAIGHQTPILGDAIRAVAPGGQIFYFGIPAPTSHPFDLWTFLRKNLTMTAGTTVRRRYFLQLAAAYLDQHPGLAAAYISHVFDIGDLHAAYERAAHPSAGQLKVVLRADWTC
jgi:L-iditol 2-dehydrogenase